MTVIPKLYKWKLEIDPHRPYWIFMLALHSIKTYIYFQPTTNHTKMKRTFDCMMLKKIQSFNGYLDYTVQTVNASVSPCIISPANMEATLRLLVVTTIPLHNSYEFHPWIKPSGPNFWQEILRIVILFRDTHLKKRLWMLLWWIVKLNDYFPKSNNVKVHLTSLKTKSNYPFQSHSISCQIE